MPAIIDMVMPITQLECQYCKKAFKHSGKLKHHIETACKNAPHQQLRDKDQTMEIRLAKIESLYIEKTKELERRLNAHDEQINNHDEQINNHDEQINDITETINEIAEAPIININIRKVIIQTPVLYINNFKEEPLIGNVLTHEELQDVVEKGGNAVRQFVEYKHYNKNNPTNHNILLKQKKATIAQIFNGNKFIDTPIEELLTYLISTTQDEITVILQMPKIKITYLQQRHINKLQLNIKENKAETIEMLKDELRKLMYNNYELVMSTYIELIKNISRKRQVTEA